MLGDLPSAKTDPTAALVVLGLLTVVLLVLLLVASFWPEVRCWLKGFPSGRARHRPVRHPLGGFRCLDCSFQGADLYEMGMDDEGGYVSTERKVYTRVGEEDYKARVE